MLASLNVGSIALMTNNPDKIAQLRRYGVEIVRRIPHVIPPNEFNRDYLLTKALRSGHQLEIDGKPVLEEQDDPVVIEPGAST
jgi:GTP cyclohydrolase II